jgi:predicted amidohydrolase
MRCLFAAAALGVFAAALYAEIPVRQSGFSAGENGIPAGWNAWAPRAEIAPRTFVDQVHFRSHPGSLAISGNSNAAEFGGWEYLAGGVTPGTWYRFSAYYRSEGPLYEPLQILPRLDWQTGDGKRAGQPDYVWSTSRDGDWTRVSLDAPAPEKASKVKLQLLLVNAPHATVWWDDVALESIPAPGSRSVRVAAVNLRPRETGSAAESVRRFLETIESGVKGADVILLPEGITVVGTGKNYAEIAETVPGPTTARLGEMARRKNAYIIAGIYEREGQAIYNTAVLIDRKGDVLGKYRKVYLPREEIEGGLTPGNDYPVFQTDFGKVGMMICWDVQYADPARNLALRGAELIFLPIWGGNETLGKARAIENQVFLVSSGYDYPTYVMDPSGEILSQAKENGKIATATIDLNLRYLDPWLGDMRERFQREVRLDLKVSR